MMIKGMLFNRRALSARIGPYPSTFCAVETKSMFKHTRVSAPKRFAKFGRQTRTLEKGVSQTRVRQTIYFWHYR